MIKRAFNQSIDSPAGTLFVGIDIAKDKHCARALNSLNKLESEALFFCNRRKGFEELIDRIGRWCRKYNCSSIIIGMEPTAGYWMPLFYYLQQNGLDVKLVSSLKVKRSKDLKDNSPLKSDKKDALLIAALTRDGNVLSYQSPTDDIQAVKKLVKLAEDLDETATIYRNRLEYFLSVHFPELGDVLHELGGHAMRALLKEYPFPQDLIAADPQRVKQILWIASRGKVNGKKVDELLETAKETVGIPEKTPAERLPLKVILEVLDLMEDNSRQVRAQLEDKLGTLPQYHILRSIKGIGLMTAAVMIAALGDLRQYKNAKQLLKKAGLNLYRFSSGKFRGTDRISRRGMPLLRRYLFMAALVSTREGGVFFGKYNSMLKNGVMKKKALVGIMRKLLGVAYALVRDERLFEVDYKPADRAKRVVSEIRQAKAA